MAYITPNSSDSSFYDLYIQGDGEIYANKNSSNLFAGFQYVDSINNIGILNTSNVTNMSRMFFKVGYNSKVFTLDLGDDFNTSKVTNMGHMFDGTGMHSTLFTLNLGDKFDTSNVTTMDWMFTGVGASNTLFTLDLGNKFDTINVTNMNGMFWDTGYYSKVFKLDCSKWNVDKVTNYGAFGDTSKITPPIWVN